MILIRYNYITKFVVVASTHKPPLSEWVLSIHPRMQIFSESGLRVDEKSRLLLFDWRTTHQFNSISLTRKCINRFLHSFRYYHHHRSTHRSTPNTQLLLPLLLPDIEYCWGGKWVVGGCLIDWQVEWKRETSVKIIPRSIATWLILLHLYGTNYLEPFFGEMEEWIILWYLNFLLVTTQLFCFVCRLNVNSYWNSN